MSRIIEQNPSKTNQKNQIEITELLAPIYIKKYCTLVIKIATENYFLEFTWKRKFPECSLELYHMLEPIFVQWCKNEIHSTIKGQQTAFALAKENNGAHCR